MANYAAIRDMDISNGDGIGVSVFFSGCDFKCKNCFNHQLQDYNYGQQFTNKEICLIVNLMSRDYISRLSILGGDGLMLQNLESTLELVTIIKNKFPNKKIWLYTGYTFEQIMNASEKNKGSQLRKAILNFVDVLVDGLYEDDKKDFRLRFRGSSNQRIWRKVGTEWIIEEDAR